MLTLLVMTDGRKECVFRAIPYALSALSICDQVVIHDDSGDPNYRAWLRNAFPEPGFEIIGQDTRQGFGGAIRSAWAWLRTHDRNPVVFHLEDDFLITKPLDVQAIRRVLDQPHVKQVALLRQPWSPEETRAGGIMPRHGVENFKDCGGWFEHSVFWTTNPHLVERSTIVDYEWPEVVNSEGMFTRQILKDGNVSTFWGSGDLWCEHIGTERVGNGY